MKHNTQAAPPYSEAQTTAWLSWLAAGMQCHGQTVFQIEQLQPDWLHSRSQLIVYILGSRLASGLAVSLAIAIIVNINAGLIMGFFSALTAGIVDTLRLTARGGRSGTRSGVALSYIAASMLSLGLPIWILGWIVGRLIGDSFEGLVLGWVFSTVFAVTYGLRIYWRGYSTDIRTTEALHWSWSRAAKSGVAGLSLGLLAGIISETSYRIAFHRPIAAYFNWWLEAAMLVGLVGALCGVIFGGLDSGVIKTKTAPNQGIRLSFRNAVFAGAIAGSLIGLVGAVSVDSLGELLVSLTGLYRLQGGLSFGLTGGLLVALWYGGIDIIQHYTLRLVLSIKGYAPLHYAHFLDYTAAELHFLQKVGGGYMFVHRYLLEYFAAMEQPKPVAPADRQNVAQPAGDTA